MSKIWKISQLFLSVLLAIIAAFYFVLKPTLPQYLFTKKKSLALTQANLTQQKIKNHLQQIQKQIKQVTQPFNTSLSALLSHIIMLLQRYSFTINSIVPLTKSTKSPIVLQPLVIRINGQYKNFLALLNQLPLYYLQTVTLSRSTANPASKTQLHITMRLVMYYLKQPSGMKN